MGKQRSIATYNVELLADKATLDYWTTLLDTQAEAFNMCVNLLKDKKDLNIKVVHCICYRTIRKAFDITAEGAIRAQKEAASMIKSMRSNKHDGNLPQKQTKSVTLDKRMYSRLTDSSIAICGGERYKRVTVPFRAYGKLKEMFAAYKACDPVLFLRKGKLWLSIPFSVPEKPVTNDESVGVDLGMKRLFVTSDGKAFRDKTYLSARRRVRHLKSALRKKGTKSARKHLRKLSRRERNLSKDMQCRAVNALLSSTDAGILVLEDLTKIKQSTKKGPSGHLRKRHNSAIGQVPFAEFRDRLAVKALRVGKRVVTVNPKDTSRTDSRTGKKDGIRKGCRYRCSDGVMLDADWNAAVNIAKRGKHPLSNVCPVDGRVVFLSGRPKSTGRMHVSHVGKSPCLASPRL